MQQIKQNLIAHVQNLESILNDKEVRGYTVQQAVLFVNTVRGIFEIANSLEVVSTPQILPLDNKDQST